MATTHCIFCAIVAGQEPASKVFENESILAFLNIRSAHEGECLMIPKDHIDHFMDVPSDQAAEIAKVAQLVAQNMRRVLQPQRVGLLVSGYGVPHAHMIVTPLFHEHDITSQHFAVHDQVTFSDQHIPLTSRDRLDELAQQLLVTI